MRTFIMLLLTIGFIVFVIFMPSLFWNTEWQTIFEVAFSEEDETLQDIVNIFGEDSPKQTAIKYLAICAGVVLGGLVVLYIISKFLKLLSKVK